MRTHFVRFAHTTSPTILLWLTYFECVKLRLRTHVATSYMFTSVWTRRSVASSQSMAHASNIYIHLCVRGSVMWKWTDQHSIHLIPLNEIKSSQLTNKSNLNQWNNILSVCVRPILYTWIWLNSTKQQVFVEIVCSSLIQWTSNNEYNPNHCDRTCFEKKHLNIRSSYKKCDVWIEYKFNSFTAQLKYTQFLLNQQIAMHMCVIIRTQIKS